MELKRPFLSAIFLILFSFTISAGCLAQDIPLRVDTSKESFKDLREFIGLLSARKFDQIIDKSNTILESKPAFAEVYLFRGLAYMETKATGEALRDFRKAIELGTDKFVSFNAYRLRALLLFNEKDFDNAIKDLTVLIEGAHKDMLVSHDFTLRGRAFAVSKKLKEALSDFDTALKLFPKEKTLHLFRAWANFDLGNFEKAIEDAGEEMKVNPLLKDSYVLRAKAYRKLNQIALAEADEKKVAGSLYSGGLNPEIVSSIGNLIKAKNYDGVIDSATKGLLDFPESGDLYFYRGLGSMGKFSGILRDTVKPEAAKVRAEAIADLSKAMKYGITESLNKYQALKLRATLLYASARYDESLVDIEECLKIQPKDFQNHIYKGMILFEKKQYKPSIEALKIAETINAKDLNLFLLRAKAYFNAGDFENVINDANSAIAINPDSFLAYQWRAKAYKGQGKTDLAEADDIKAIELEVKRNSQKK